MASSAERGAAFSLVVALSTSPRTAIKPHQREKIFEYMKSQIPLFKEHVHTVEEIDYFDIITITKDAKTTIRLELSVSDSNNLDKFFDFAKNQQDKKNGLSYIFSTFFQNQEMQLKCGFQSSTKINISVSMSDRERKKVAADLEKKLAKVSAESKKKENSARYDNKSTNSSSKSSGNHSAEVAIDFSNVKPVKSVIEQFESRDEQTNVKMDGREQDSQIRMTFHIDVPDKEITSVRIKSHSIQELNREMFHSTRHIYSVDVELPVQYDPYAYYWYEIGVKESLILISYSKEVISRQYNVGDKTVHRDLRLGLLDSACLHLQDIVYNRSDRYSDSELCMQIEDICKQCSYFDDIRIIRNLMNSDIIHSSKHLVRFALIVGNLCKNFSEAIYNQINQTVAKDILDALSQRSLADFPASCIDYMPNLCKHLCKIQYGNEFCVLLFLSRVSSFLPGEQQLSVLQGCLSTHEKFITDSPLCGKLANQFCRSFYIEYITTGNLAVKDIVEYLFRHLPLEMTLPSYGQIVKHSAYEDDRIKEREDDALTAVNASIKSQVLSFANKAMKEKRVSSLLKTATLVGRFELNADTSIRNTFEDGVISCFSWYSLKETIVKQEVEDFLELSGCFMNIEVQLQLLKSISESRNPNVRRLFIDLNEDKFLLDAYGCLEIEVYTSWLQNEIKTNQTRNEDEILVTFRTLCEILKLPVVMERAEVQKELEVLTMNSLKRYTLRDMVQHIEKIEHLCDKEPTVSYLYKEQVHQLLKKKGYTPTEVLKLFCWNNTLRVNTVTTGEIVCTITDLFFGKSLEEELFDNFISQIPHVAFWEIIKNADGMKIQAVRNNGTYKQVMSCIKHVTVLLRNSEVDISFMSKINVKDEKTKRILQLGGMHKKDIDAMQTYLKETVAKVTRDAKCVIAVLEEVQDRRSNSAVPELSVILKEATLIKVKIESGSLSVKESTSPRHLWGDLHTLPAICSALEPVIKSNVFWNVAEKAVLESFTLSIQTGTPTDGLMSVRYLFDSEAADDYVDEIQKN